MMVQSSGGTIWVWTPIQEKKFGPPQSDEGGPGDSPQKNFLNLG